MDLDKRPLLVVACCLLLVVAGCAGGGDGGAPAVERPSGDGGAGGAGDAGADTASDGGTGVPAAGAVVENRAQIQTGEATVTVDSFADAQTAAVAAARERGGFVDASEQRVHRDGNRSWTTGSLTLRVPSENFSGLVETVHGLGEVESVSTRTVDVTDQLVDLNARIENLEGQRDQLRSLYNRTNETEDLLRIQERLGAVQTEIERLSAQRQSLRDRVAYSTLTLHIEEDRPGRTFDTERWYDTPLVGAFLQSIDGVVVALRMLAVGAAYAAPYVIVFGTPVAGAVWLLRRRIGRGGSEGAPAADGAEPEDGDETEETENASGDGVSDEGTATDADDADSADGAEDVDDVNEK